MAIEAVFGEDAIDGGVVGLGCIGSTNEAEKK
jgi:hypothetical protein